MLQVFLFAIKKKFGFRFIVEVSGSKGLDSHLGSNKNLSQKFHLAVGL